MCDRGASDLSLTGTPVFHASDSSQTIYKWAVLVWAVSNQIIVYLFIALLSDVEPHFAVFKRETR